MKTGVLEDVKTAAGTEPLRVLIVEHSRPARRSTSCGMFTVSPSNFSNMWRIAVRADCFTAWKRSGGGATAAS